MSQPPNLQDVQARRLEIKAELATVREQEKALATEDQELEIAERVLLRLAGAPEAPVLIDEALGAWKDAHGWKRPDQKFEPAYATIEDTIEWLLEGAVDPWATSIQIQVAAAGTLNRPVPMSTISPTLTNMKNKGTIVRDGFKVALATRVQKENETAPIKKRSL
jgi:hypothetical protein